MDTEVGRTLAELERKLHELERALSAAPERSTPTPSSRPQPSPQAPAPPLGGAPDAPEPPLGVAPGAPVSGHATGARLVDEELSERPSPYEPAPDTRSAWGAAPPVSPQSRAAAPTPARSSPSEAIELGELVRFRDKLSQTVSDLVEEYSAIITLHKAEPGSATPEPGRATPDQGHATPEQGRDWGEES